MCFVDPFMLYLLHIQLYDQIMPHLELKEFWEFFLFSVTKIFLPHFYCQEGKDMNAFHLGKTLKRTKESSILSPATKHVFTFNRKIKDGCGGLIGVTTIHCEGGRVPLTFQNCFRLDKTSGFNTTKLYISPERLSRWIKLTWSSSS